MGRRTGAVPAATRLADGRLPLWNDAVGLGAPLAANPNMAAWSPLQLAVNLAPSPTLQDRAWVLRVWLLAVATWALARALGCGHPLGALTGRVRDRAVRPDSSTGSCTTRSTRMRSCRWHSRRRCACCAARARRAARARARGGGGTARGQAAGAILGTAFGAAAAGGDGRRADAARRCLAGAARWGPGRARHRDVAGRCRARAVPREPRREQRPRARGTQHGNRGERCHRRRSVDSPARGSCA